MLFQCKISVTIAGSLLTTVHSVHAKNDAKEIGSSCKIVVPLACRIQQQTGAHEYVTDLAKNLFKQSDPVTVTAWYVDELGNDMPKIQIFSGFIYEFIEGTPTTIECLDNIFLLNQSTVNLSYKTTTIRQVINDILKGTGITLQLPTIDLQLKNLTFRIMSPAAVLQWFKTEIGLNISLSGKQLYCNIASNTISTVKYLTTRNVIRSNLQKPEAVYLKLKLKAWFILSDGRKTSLEVGDPDGELREVFFYSIPFNTARYTQLAQEALTKYKQMKFSGMIETLLYPDCGLFWRAEYNDKTYPERNGVYTVVGMDYSLDDHGFHRHIRLAYLSDFNGTNTLGKDNNIINLQP